MQHLRKKQFSYVSYPLFDPNKIQAYSLLKTEVVFPRFNTPEWQPFVEELKATFDLSAVAYANQVHDIAVEPVYSNIHDQYFEAADGLVTNQKGVGLLVFHADCQAGFFYDPIQSVICLVHAGWRGQLKGMYQAAITKMQSLYGSKPEDIIASISFGLCIDHSEFIHYQTEFPESYWKYKDHRHHFDLKKITYDQLLRLGIRQENLFVSSDCTYENPLIFYSYRRDKLRANHVSLIAIK